MLFWITFITDKLLHRKGGRFLKPNKVNFILLAGCKNSVSGLSLPVMKRLFAPAGLALLFFCASAAYSAPGDSLGIFDDWGAFRADAGGRCTAIAQPGRSSGGGEKGRAYAAVSTWPDRRIGVQFYVRLSRPQADNSRIWLSIGERRFALIAGKGEAWAQNVAMDGAIIAAMRATTTMSIEAKGRDGRAFYDLYVLKGAATAMDAARLTCLSK